tara:strand:- start:919 stop:1602 length:684 start_codon:yes stop_codon:yes gene_type:complete
MNSGMKKVAKWLFAVLGVIILVGFAVYLYGNYVISVGTVESKWIREDMWDAQYFNQVAPGLTDDEAVNLATLQSGAADNDKLVHIVKSARCMENNERCHLNDLSYANLLLDLGDYDKAMKVAENAYSKYGSETSCPIGFESTMLLYGVSRVSDAKSSDLKSHANSFVNKLKEQGGVVFDLRTEECDELARQKPERFSEYVMLVARVMAMGDRNLSYASAVIESENKR